VIKMTVEPAERRMRAVRIQAVLAACWPWLALAVSLATAGCMTTTKIRPWALDRLDGYQASTAPQAGRELETLDGDMVKVRQQTRLYLRLEDGVYGGRFDSIRVRHGVFDGLTVERQQIRVPMAEIKAARLQELNTAKTGLVFFGVVVVAVLGLAWFANLTDSGTHGRALRVGGRVVTARLAPAAAATGWGCSASAPMTVDTSSLSAAARAALADAWTERARSEHASVPAFSRLSLTLMAMGAPAQLVEAAHRAAIEEIGHARLVFGMAEAYLGAPVAPGPLAELRAAPAVTALSLAELAAESLIDGCLMEGVAAATAEAESACALDPVLRDALATIAREERSHAELGWAIVSWSCQQGASDEVARRLLRAIGQVPPVRPPLEVPPVLEPEVTAHGFLAAAAWRDLFQRERTAVASRLAIVARLGVTAAS
jgi:hypothetical protein